MISKMVILIWNEYKKSFSFSRTFLVLILMNLLLLTIIVAGAGVLKAEIDSAFQKIPEVPDINKELSLEEMQILQSKFENSIGRMQTLFWIAALSSFVLIILSAAAILLILFRPKKFLLRFIPLNVLWYAAWALLFGAVFRYTAPQLTLAIILGGLFIYTTPIFSVLSIKKGIPYKKTLQLAISKFPSLIQPFGFAAATLIVLLGLLLLLYFAPPLLYSIATIASLVWYLSWLEMFVISSIHHIIEKI